jgi:tRNA pseudouridine55 synthase
MNKANQEKINGILLLDKPYDKSSNGALQHVKNLFCALKAGHTGSLDPLATGMLPICFGEATKLSQFLLESDKYYEVQARLGVRTGTGDAEGEVISTRPAEHITQALLQAACQQFIGDIQQVPPMFSAIKFRGQPLYKLARRGIEVERQARSVKIFKLDLLSCQGLTFKISLHCTKGTYVRTLIDDIGEVLGCGAHVTQLRRSAVAPYQNERMFTLTELEKIRAEDGSLALKRLLLPLETSAQNYPALQLSATAAFYLRMGQPVMAAHIRTNGLIRIFSPDGRFMGIGEMLNDGRVTPKRLLNLAAH